MPLKSRCLFNSIESNAVTSDRFLKAPSQKPKVNVYSIAPKVIVYSIAPSDGVKDL